jgi:hypothetical protein
MARDSASFTFHMTMTKWYEQPGMTNPRRFAVATFAFLVALFAGLRRMRATQWGHRAGNVSRRNLFCFQEAVPEGIR